MQAARVTPTISVTDILPIDTLTRVMIRAYKNLHQSGEISIQFPVRIRGRSIQIDYLSPIPADWIRQIVSDTAEHGRAALEAERDKMEARLEMLLSAAAPCTANPAGRPELLPQILAAQKRYMEINEILEN